MKLSGSDILMIALAAGIGAIVGAAVDRVVIPAIFKPRDPWQVTP